MTEGERDAMDLPTERWHAAIGRRRSRRAYDGAPIEPDALRALSVVCNELRAPDGTRVELVAEPPVDVFRGLLGSYGKIHGNASVLLFIAADPTPRAQWELGYIGEGVVLEATALALGTCWVSGFFDPGRARHLTSLAAHERVVAASPLGHPVAETTATERAMSAVALSHRRKPLDEIAPGWQQWPLWAQRAVEAARLAPSATNRQPWRFSLIDGALVASRNSRTDLPRASKALDVGIACMHLELGAGLEGVTGTWLRPTDQGRRLEVARFAPAS